MSTSLRKTPFSAHAVGEMKEKKRRNEKKRPKQKEDKSAIFQNAVAANAKRQVTLCLCEQIECGNVT